jgi:hypothetical protein
LYNKYWGVALLGRIGTCGLWVQPLESKNHSSGKLSQDLKGIKFLRSFLFRWYDVHGYNLNVGSFHSPDTQFWPNSPDAAVDICRIEEIGIIVQQARFESLHFRNHLSSSQTL